MDVLSKVAPKTTAENVVSGVHNSAIGIAGRLWGEGRLGQTFHTRTIPPQELVTFKVAAWKDGSVGIGTLPSDLACNGPVLTRHRA